ncbi:MAG: RNA pseudouridine synthase [Bacteroidetes bacterium]|nr:RNA pseudouridine synthase [Bacteroidota bacterium]
MKKPEVIFENEDFITINKPAGLLSIPDRTQSAESLKDILIKQYGQIFTVHRLDKETSGLIVFAKNEIAHKHLSKAFEERSVEKIYVGIVQGTLTEEEGVVDAEIMEHPAKNGTMITHKKGKAASTEYKVLESLGPYSLLQFQIHTGRTHQIRVHMKHIGHPIVCDPLYGNPQPIFISSFKRKYKLSKSEEEEKPILHRLGLHAHQLKFKDEKEKEYLFEAELPKDMRALVNQLKKNF